MSRPRWVAAISVSDQSLIRNCADARPDTVIRRSKLFIEQLEREEKIEKNQFPKQKKRRRLTHDKSGGGREPVAKFLIYSQFITALNGNCTCCLFRVLRSSDFLRVVSSSDALDEHKTEKEKRLNKGKA